MPLAEPVYDKDLHPDLAPWAEDGAFDAVRAAHLLNRAGFGGLPAEVEAIQSLGVARAVDALLDFPDAPAGEQSRTDVPDAAVIADVPKSDLARRQRTIEVQQQAREQQRMNAEAAEADTAAQLERQRWNRASREHMNACGRWWLDRMGHGPYPLQEKLVLFWHGHFTSSFRDDREGSWRMWGQNELLRTFAAGDFGQFVRRVSRDPAMLKYLNNDANINLSPNENYARELMELFTLGIGERSGANYTEDDIKQAARAFTGWTHDGEQFTFRQRLHDDRPKRIFGQEGRYGGDEVVDLLLRHRATGPHIAGKLYTFFVGDRPPADVEASLGRVLVNSNYELRPLLRTILRSNAFFDAERIGAKIKSPIQLAVGTARLLGVDLSKFRRINGELEKMGQVPFAPPNVKGWPGQFDGRRWINTATLLTRYNFCVRVADAAKVEIDTSAAGSEFVEEWLGRLIPRPVDPAKKRQLVAKIGSRPSKSGFLDALRLIVSLPEFQLC